MSHKNHKRRGQMSAPERRRRVETLIEIYGLQCWLCKEPIDRSLVNGNPMRLSLDHVIPLSRGGSNHIHNLRLAHACCNEERDCNRVKL